MTIIATTSPGFGQYGSVPEKIEKNGWKLIRCIDNSQPDGGLSDHLNQAEYLVAGLLPVTESTLEAAPRLKAVLKHGVGVDNIDIAACTRRGLPVLNTPGSNSGAVAELAIGMMLALARNIPPAHNSVISGGWDRRVGSEIAGKTLGIVGLGNIGKSLALKATGLGLKIIATDLYPDKGFIEANGIELLPLEDLLRRSDYVSLHVFGGADNSALIDSSRLALMKPGARLLNLARGEVVDLDALHAALEAGRLAGAGIDAYVQEPPDTTHPIYSNPRVVFLPHSGADTVEAVERVGLMNVADIEEMIAGGQPRRVLNPEVYRS